MGLMISPSGYATAEHQRDGPAWWPAGRWTHDARRNTDMQLVHIPLVVIVYGGIAAIVVDNEAPSRARENMTVLGHVTVLFPGMIWVVAPAIRDPLLPLLARRSAPTISVTV